MLCRNIYYVYVKYELYTGCGEAPLHSQILGAFGIILVLSLLRILSACTSYLVEDTFRVQFFSRWSHFPRTKTFFVFRSLAPKPTSPQANRDSQDSHTRTLEPQTYQPPKEISGRTLEKRPPNAPLTNRYPEFPSGRTNKSAVFLRRIVWGSM